MLAIGEFLIDLIASDDATSLLDVETLAVRPGGAPGQCRCRARASGSPRRTLRGGWAGSVRRSLARACWMTNGVDRTPRAAGSRHADTTLAFAWKDERGDGHFRLLRQADILLDVDDIVAADIEQHGRDRGRLRARSVSNHPALAIEWAVELTAYDEACRFASMSTCGPTIWRDREAAWPICEPILDSQHAGQDEPRRCPVPFRSRGQMRRQRMSSMLLGRYENQFVVITDGARGAWFANWLDGRHTPPRMFRRSTSKQSSRPAPEMPLWRRSSRG